MWTRRGRLVDLERGQRCASSSMAMRLSMRASAAPRQLCTPWPKPSESAVAASMSKPSGSLERPLVARRRAGDEEHREAGRDRARRAASTSLRRRSGPGTATAGRSGGSPRPRRDPPGRRGSSATGRGCWANSTTALPTSLVTVSAPAPPRSVAKPAISTSSSRSPAVAAVDLDLREAAEHVVGGVAPASRRPVVEVGASAIVGLAGHARRRISARSGRARGAGSMSSHSRICWRSPCGHAEHARDDLDRERARRSRRRRRTRRVRRAVVEVAADDLADHRLERR